MYTEQVTAQDGEERPAISSISKALTVFEVLTDHATEPLGVSELALAVGLPKSTAHRLLVELEQHGLVGRSGRRYQVGRKLFELAALAQHSVVGRLRTIALPILGRVFERTGMTVHLATLHHDDVLVVEKITGPNGWTIPSTVGGRLPASCTAMGKALLAASPERPMPSTLPVRTRYSITAPGVLAQQLDAIRGGALAAEREELRLGVSCVATAVRVADQSVCAISVSGPCRQIDPARLAPILRTETRALAALLCP